LQRSVAKLPDVFKQYDKNGDSRLDLEEFSELDFHFPWDQFPLHESIYQQVFFGAGSTPQSQAHQPPSYIGSDMIVGPSPSVPKTHPLTQQ